MATFALGFIGAGNMAEAIARGVIRSGLYRPEQIQASDPVPARRAVFQDDLKIACHADSTVVAAAADIIVLAVKPQMMAAALGQIRAALRPDTLVITIAAGISCAYIESQLAPATRVVRVMPNTPMLVGAGISGIAAGAHAGAADVQLVERIFQAGGQTVRVPEAQINALTALSGSGPAYVFYLTEVLAAAGVSLGLAPADAAVLARQTVIGAAQLLGQSTESPEQLRRRVTSPGGTTQAALETLQCGDLAALFRNALAAAERRGKELGQ